MDKNEVEQAIQNFLETNNNLSLHPGRTPGQWAKLVVKDGGCPCVPGRTKCPCDEALKDIESLNHCRCYLFVNEAYLKLYDQMVNKRKSGKKLSGE